MGGGSDGGSTIVKREKTMTPEQREVEVPFSEWLMEELRGGLGLPRYEGQLYAPMSGALQELYGQFQAPFGYAQEMLPSAVGAFRSALSGRPSTAITSDVDRYIAAQRPAAERILQEEILPGVREAFRGPGTYWGGVRAKEEERARRAFEENRLAQEETFRWNAIQQATDRQLGAAGVITQYYDQALSRATSAEETQRLEQQRQIDIEYQNWVKSLPQLSPTIQHVLAYLGTPLMGVGFGREYSSPSAWSEAGTAALAKGAEVGGEWLAEKLFPKKDETPQASLSGMVGSQLGGIGGATLGSMILPGIGTAAGGFLGSQLGGYLGPVISKVNPAANSSWYNWPVEQVGSFFRF